MSTGVVVWVGATGRRQYLKGADVAFTGDAIDFVGAGQPILEDFGFLTLGLGPLMATTGPAPNTNRCAGRFWFSNQRS